MDTDAIQGFWMSKNVRQTAGLVSRTYLRLASSYPCESASIRGFFCIFPD